MTHLSKSKKAVLGIFTFLPVVLFILYFVFFFLFFFQGFSELEQGGFSNNNELPFGGPEHFFGNFLWLFFIILAMLILNLGLMVFYIIHVFKNPKFQKDGNMKIIWVLLMIFGSLVGNIIYFFIEILPLPNEKQEVTIE